MFSDHQPTVTTKCFLKWGITNEPMVEIKLNEKKTTQKKKAKEETENRWDK